MQTTSTTDSPFHISHATFTDVTIYPPPLESHIDGPIPKKRKREGEILESDPTASSGNSETHHSLYSSRILANKHMSQKVHNLVKVECEQLAAMIVSAPSCVPSLPDVPNRTR